MGLSEQLMEDQKTAMKAKDKFRLTVIRLLRSEIKNAEIAKKTPLEEEEIVVVLHRELKRRKDALVDFEKADRPSLLEELKEEITIISGYLPPQLSKDEIREIIREAITGLGASSKKDMGRVMGFIMPKLKGKAEGSLVKEILEELLR
ncbi:MAG: GatB/YqeY domain-containing protein [Bacillota bacterium]|nr:GatB/YqeY domain-containing protein [Bacillota bacterium]